MTQILAAVFWYTVAALAVRFVHKNIMSPFVYLMLPIILMGFLLGSGALMCLIPEVKCS